MLSMPMDPSAAVRFSPMFRSRSTGISTRSRSRRGAVSLIRCRSNRGTTAGPVMDFDGDARIFVGEEFRDPSRVRGEEPSPSMIVTSSCAGVMISFKR